MHLDSDPVLGSVHHHSWFQIKHADMLKMLTSCLIWGHSAFSKWSAAPLDSDQVTNLAIAELSSSLCERTQPEAMEKQLW